MSIGLFRWQKEVFIDRKEKFIIVPAGRRTGKTQGAEIASVVFAAQGDKCLWVDTIYSNIDRYVDRYFIPDLKAGGLDYEWNKQKKILIIENGYIDFRSADRPESIEGFGYHKIFLNEAGIILNNDYLYTNAILPMLMDFDESQLYAFGTPKGITNKLGNEHRFFTLWKKAESQDDKYYGRQLSSYDNPLINDENIADLEKEMSDISEEAVLQEIGGQFVTESEDKVYNSSQLDRFCLEDIQGVEVVGRVGSIDVADEGMDFLSFPIGKLIGTKIYITDWIFTNKNTDYTMPLCSSLIMQERLDYCAIETNNHGSVFFKGIENEVSGTDLLPIFQKAKKHSRIVQNAGFVRQNFVFRNDYEKGSDYDKAMKQLFMYTKDGKYKKDDSPDSISLLSAVFRDLYSAVWY